MNTQSADITIYGDDADDWSGFAVASGEINGDRYEDIIVTAHRADPPGGTDAGETYVIFGSSNAPSIIDLNSQSADITVYGDDADDRSGYAVASGDINGDGYDDLIIGAPYADPSGRSDAGEAYIILSGVPITVAPFNIIAGHGKGGDSWVKLFEVDGNPIRAFKVFGSVNAQGEVQVAGGDVDADGKDELAAGQGEGGKSWVKFFEVNGSLISGFKAFGAANSGGEVHLAIGNFDTELSDKEIAVGHGEGGKSWVKVFKADGTCIRSFKVFGDKGNSKGEVHLAAGDLNKDGFDEIITGTGEGSISVVKIFHYWGGHIRTFTAFGSLGNPGGEVHLAVGNFDADSDIEIAVATGYNGGNWVKLFKKDGTFINKFKPFVFAENPNGDVQITAADIDNDGIGEIICGHGEGGRSWIRVFKADGTIINNFKAFGAVNAQGEVHLARCKY